MNAFELGGTFREGLLCHCVSECSTAPLALHIAASLGSPAVVFNSVVKLRFKSRHAKVLTCGASYDWLVHVISRDRPCYYLTSVTKDRLPVFRTAHVNTVVCQAMEKARQSGGFFIYAYVIMLDHLHVVTDSTLLPSKTLQFVNGIISRRLIDYLKKGCYEDSLEKLRTEIGRRRRRYSLWDHHPDARILFTESMLMQRVNYTHMNPVRASLVGRPEDYQWSSARLWAGRMLEDEPLLVDLDQIKWRRP